MFKIIQIYTNYRSFNFCCLFQLLSQINIEPCPECGHLKQKHVLCGFCYAKVCKETGLIREKIKEMEGGPLRTPSVETVVLYEGETPSEQDKDKRIVERQRKRPSWFSYWAWAGEARRSFYTWRNVSVLNSNHQLEQVSNICHMIHLFLYKD